MARPLRIEFAEALYHITSRGNARGDIYATNNDRIRFLDQLEQVCHRKAILVQKDTYLLELARYIVLNPVRARMVRTAQEWPWSSYRATAGQALPHDCLTIDWILSVFGSFRGRAQAGYRKFVRQGKNQPSPWALLKNQIYLGSDTFVEDMQLKITADQSLNDIPRKQKQAPPKPLQHYDKTYKTRNEAMAKAYLSGHYTLEQVGEYFGVSYATVSRAVSAHEASISDV